MKLRGTIKKTSLLLIFAVAVLVSAGAQTDRIDRDNIAILQRLELNAQELQSIVNIQKEYLDSRKMPQAELDVIRAQVTRELLADNPDLGAIERLIRTGLDFEVTIRMAEIKRELAMKNVLGDRRWAVMKQISRELQARGVSIPELSNRLKDSHPELLPTLRVMELYSN